MVKKKLLAVIFVLVFLLAGASVFGFLSWKHKSEMVASPVSFTVNAQGWDAESSSPVPLHVTGKTLDDEKVDTKYFVGGSGKNSSKDLMLKPGAYEVEVYASPVNADGGMYRCPKAARLSVPKNTGGKQNVSKPEKTGEAEAQPSASASADSGSVVSAEFELSPIPANEITDEDIEKAQAAMKDAGLDEGKIKTFTDSARKARQTELDRIEKERKAKEEAELMQKTFASFAGEYWFYPAYTYCGMQKMFTLDSTGKAHGSFDRGHMGVATRNEFSITFSNPVPRADGFEATYQIAYAHTPGTLDPRDDYPCETPESCTFGELYSPSSGKAFFYNSAAQADSDVVKLWSECHISDSTSSYSSSIDTKPDSSRVRVIKLQNTSNGVGDIFFSK